MALGVWLLVLGCGRKGPPLPPLVVIPPGINDLTAKVLGDGVRLTWSIPKKGVTLFEGIRSFRVFRYRVNKAGSLCSGCPLPFREFLEIRLKYPGPARIEDGRVIYSHTLDPEYQYGYKIVVHHKSGGISDDSNVVHVTAE
jgi:hypothetical protein